MKEVNPKQQIHKDWLAARDARDKAWKIINEDPCHPYRKKLVKEWQELFDQEAALYNKLTSHNLSDSLKKDKNTCKKSF